MPHDRDRIEQFVQTLMEALERNGYTDASRFAVRLAFEEALSNAYRHGHKHLPADTHAHAGYAVTPEEVTLYIRDQGPGFDPGAVPDPTLDENLENISGRGLMLIRAYMTSVTHNKSGTEVRMVYRKPPAGTGLPKAAKAG